MHSRAAVSLAEVAAVGVRLRPTDAVTIVRELVLQVATRALPGVPSAHVIRLSPSGAITVEGPVVATGWPVPRAAQLLAALLPEVKRVGAASTPLGRVMASALQRPSGFATLEAFADALAPFAAHDATAAIIEVTTRWAEASGGAGGHLLLPEAEGAIDSAGMAAGPTVSDIRRARRDTGLSLDEVSRKSRIPVAMLRQLEWGYLRNWPKGLYGRTQLVRYARAARLDRQLVLDVMWPLVDEQAAEVVASASDAIVIVQPAFAPDEVLFETEGDAAAVTPGAASAPPPHASAWPLAEHGDPPSRADGPRRSSKAGAAAVLALAAAGVVWSIRGNPSSEPRVTAHVVRRLPAGRDVPALSRPLIDTPSDRPVPTTRRRSTGEGAPAISTAGLRSAAHTRTTSAALDTRLDDVNESEDETVSSPSFASAGGVAFADPVQSAVEEPGAAGAGLGLRITRVADDHGRNYHARSSPDGTRIAFDSDRDGERAVFLADASGRNLRRISGDGFAAVPSWSPDGRSLSYVRAELDNPNVWNLWLLDLASGASRRLTSNASGRPQGGSWFPDGNRIAYSRGHRIVVLDVHDGTPTVYPSPQPRVTPGPPAVSPSGRSAIFQVPGDGAWLLDFADGSARKVLSDPTAGDFTWSPDGGRVAYYSRRQQEWGVWMTMAR